MPTIRSKRFPDGNFYQSLDDGPWVVQATVPLFGPNFPEGEPVYDPENPPSTPEQLKRMRRVSLAKHLRFKFGLTQEEFAGRYHIPIGTLRDWEQHRSEPDAAANAYLHAIAGDPVAVAKALEKSMHAAAE